MMSDFFSRWFRGVNRYLKDDKTSDKEAEKFLYPCAKECSDSYPLGIYQKAFAGNLPITEALASLKNLFGEGFEYSIFDDRIHLIYRSCGCELVTQKLVDATRLCDCSRLSLLYIWETLYGTGNVKVTALETILKKNSRCLFEIKVRQLGHNLD